MDGTRVWGVSIAELDGALRTVEPAALLAPGRILRRVIKYDRGVVGAGLRVPHRKTYVISRARLLALADRDELLVAADRPLPDEILLIARPEAEKLAAMTRARALVKYWRLLFHARVHAACAALSPRLTADDIQQRVEQIGAVPFAEIASVLRHDEWLLPPADERSVYFEFMAVFFELRLFAPRLLRDYFPSIGDFDAVQALLDRDVNARKLFEQTRLPDAPEPGEEVAIEDDDLIAQRKFDLQISHPQKQSERAFCKLMDRADRAEARGNDVRSAMLRTHAALVIGPKLAVTTRAEARADLARLACRLQAALELSDTDTERWAQALADLLPSSIRHRWTPEARLLYDLQKVCIDHERGVYKLDVVEWVIALGRRPLQRPLPAQREVLMSKHLRAAAGRLRSARLSPDRRRRLSKLLDAATRLAERMLRERLGPRIAEALDNVDLRPTNVPEAVARRKLVEELLDAIVDRGFLTIGDLRDAIARNNLKIRDVSGSEVIRGDQLLQADNRLAELLDGVYRRGEVYLRLPQVLSSLAFGTRRGRFLTQFVFVPFGGAFLAIEFARHVAHLPEHLTVSPIEQQPHAAGFGIADFAQILLVGFFILGLMHSPPFRQRVVEGLRIFWQGVRKVVIDLPALALQWPWVQQILASEAFRRFKQFLFKPLLFSGLLIAVLRIATRAPGSWTSWCVIFATMNLLLNSRLGRNVDELVTDWAVRGWHQVRIRIFANVLRFIADLFAQMLEGLERVLYAVDEWLRFRRGDPRIAAVLKAVLGVAWFFITYVARFCVTLLIEPQVNPIKHFPVVTVSHKLLLPLAFTAHASVPSPLAAILLKVAPVSVETANAIMATVVWGIPGIFGFLVWELKENWRIFAANRSPVLRPVVIGGKGETMQRLLRPGFHSGTVPKLFARLRRADRKAYATGQWLAPRKHRDKLHHVQVSVGHFAEREFIVLLEASGLWSSAPLAVKRVQLGLSSIEIDLRDAAIESTIEGDVALRLRFQDRDGWLLAEAVPGDWIAEQSERQARAVTTALLGLFKMAGSDTTTLQGLPHSPLLFSGTEIRWSQWVEIWQPEQAAAEKLGHHQPGELAAERGA
ncbi:MAG TPA: hypothetical protein VG713_21290 [Pirellulales bacterium]|nr:hypothetical protein [Pirellulales bacterium]